MHMAGRNEHELEQLLVLLVPDVFTFIAFRTLETFGERSQQLRAPSPGPGDLF